MRQKPERMSGIAPIIPVLATEAEEINWDSLTRPCPFRRIFTCNQFVFVVLLILLRATIVFPSVQVESARIQVAFDDQLHCSISWKGHPGGGIIAYSPEVQMGVRVNGDDVFDFQLDESRSTVEEVNDPEFGRAMACTVIGRWAKGNVRLAKTVRVLLPSSFPDSAVFQTSYTNEGDGTQRIDAVYTQRLLLDRQLAEPTAQSYDFASYQGGSYAWGKDYSLVRLRPGFNQSNFQGVGDISGEEGEGGGMPFIDLWSPEMGVALAHLEKQPEWLSLPVTVRTDGKVDAGILEKPDPELGQMQLLKPGESYRTVLNAVIFHHLDFFDALKTYGNLLRSRGVAIPSSSPPSAYEPYWKSWGFGLDFSRDQIFDALPTLRKIGISIANLDDGWFDHYGDWNVSRVQGKFPGGEKDIIAFVDRLHADGFKTNLWWYPLGVSVESELAKERPDLLVQARDGSYPKDSRDLYQLCPAHEPALKHVEALLNRFLSRWGFDGVYLDTVGLGSIPPCFNERHRHSSPLDSFRSLPSVFERIYRVSHELNPDPWLEVCICAMPHSPYNMPYYHIAGASDPISRVQGRRRIKAEKAIRGGIFCVGDAYQVPLDEWDGSSVPEDFSLTLGTGAQMTTFYTDLDSSQESTWKTGIERYRELGLASGEYVNLYDLAFDKPEIHVVRKGDDLFYGIFADVWPRNKPIELRGLDPDSMYQVLDYIQGAELGEISGTEPVIRKAFEKSLLLRVRKK